MGRLYEELVLNFWKWGYYNIYIYIYTYNMYSWLGHWHIIVVRKRDAHHFEVDPNLPYIFKHPDFFVVTATQRNDWLDEQTLITIK